MLRMFWCCAVGFVMTVASLPSARGLDVATQSPDYGRSGTARAKELVEAALQAGLAGDAAQREKLLAEAIAADGDYAPARWHTGQVKFNGLWRTPEQVGEYVASHPRWFDYKELRDGSSGTLADHVALAQWCLKNELAAEERYHWMNVLLSEPNHKLARQRLSVRNYRGGLFTAKQIADHEQLEKQAAENLRKYKPEFIELVRKARSESRSQRTAALDKIRATSDIGAIPALQEAIGRAKRDSSDPRTRDLNLALVAALSKMREHDATLNLLNYALFSQSEEVRKLAAEGLRPRPTTDYVPLLMGALEAPIEAEFDAVAAPDGTVRMIETYHQAGAESDVEHTQSTSFEVGGVFGRDRTKAEPTAVLATHMSRAQQQASRNRERIDAYNEEVEQRNLRIREVLKTAAGMDAGTEPQEYWKAWGAENEMQYSDVQPVYETYDEENHQYVYEQAPHYSYKGSVETTGAPMAVTTSTSPTFSTTIPGGVECFAPGTLVWTQAGPRPIEQIAVGEMVLAQHPSTGELAYRPVLQTTIGDPVPVLHLQFGGETITSTRGHRFWAPGEGWRMAKYLKPSARLHGLDDLVGVTAVSEGDDIACYNLIVDEFHTFFVGKSRLLVHDKSCPAPTLATIPGSVTAAMAP
jgi:hypothetical protein